MKRKARKQQYLWYGMLLCGVFLLGIGMDARIASAKKSAAVRLKKSKLTVGIGGDYTKTVSIRKGKKKLSKKQFTFRSANKKIATVNQKGVIKGKKPGKTRIVCKQKGTNKKWVCRVTVQRYIEEITAGDGYLNFYKIGEKQKIKTSIYPKKATIKKLSYKSSNPKVVKVNQSGVATCVGKGVASITVKAKDAQKTDTMIDVCLVSGYQEPFGISEKKKMPHGKVANIKYTHEGQTCQAVVYTPPNYTAQKKYNVMYLLHGGGDSALSWTENGGVNYIMDYLYSKKQAKDMILAMTNGYNEKEILESLQPYLQSHYSIATGPEHTAIIGYSMGGEAAADIGLAHPDKFSYIGLLSMAGSNAVQDYFYNQLSVKNSMLYTNPLKGIWISIGTGDTLVEAATKEARKYFESAAAKKYFADYGVKYQYYLKKTNTPHSWTEWRNGFYNFAKMAFQ